MQEYLDHAPKVRHHFRVNVVAGEAVKATEIRASGGNWLTNQAQGGESVDSDSATEDIPEDVICLALRATAAIGADYSGVDVIEGSEGAFYVLETNEFPGFRRTTAWFLSRYIIKVARKNRLGQT